jgi:hypothetical protein
MPILVGRMYVLSVEHLLFHHNLPAPHTHTTPALLYWQEAAAAKAAGRPDWWKLREAVLYAVGTVSEQLVELAGSGGGGRRAPPLDVSGLMGDMLQQDLVPAAPPFLIGRALWATSRCGGFPAASAAVCPTSPAANRGGGPAASGALPCRGGR